MENKKIALIDPFSTGHHVDYAKNAIAAAKKANMEILLICNEKMATKLSDEFDDVIVLKIDLSGGFISRELAKIKYIKKVAKLLKGKRVDVVHFLYLDRFIRALMFFSTSKNTKYFATCHWFYMLPEFSVSLKSKGMALLERLCLKFVLTKDWKIMSHSKNGSKKLIGHDKYVLDYPVEPIDVVDESKILTFRERLGLTPDIIFLLCFGGTRADKGADFAVKTLAKLDDKYHLLIAGKEECISYNMLNEIANKTQCSSRLHLFKGFVSDEDTALMFNACDIVFIPYRKNFSGQSGPLTIGASLGKTIVSSDNLVLKETIQQFKLGQVFKSENLASCQKTITDLENYPNKVADNSKFNSDHAGTKFIAELCTMYSTTQSTNNN